MTVKLDNIQIRTTFKPGDIGQIIHLHGLLYHQEFNYGLDFENYVAQSISEFYTCFDENKDCLWIA
ncbi:MAG: hypothetical protein ACSHWU_12285, partial [Marinicella sp.]